MRSWRLPDPLLRRGKGLSDSLPGHRVMCVLTHPGLASGATLQSITQRPSPKLLSAQLLGKPSSCQVHPPPVREIPDPAANVLLQMAFVCIAFKVYLT